MNLVGGFGTAVFAAVLGLSLSAVAEEPGRQFYTAQCAFCHQPSGQGAPGMYPPLAGRVGELAKTPEGMTYLAHLILYGMSGPISVEGRRYNMLMPPFQRFDAASLASVLNYVARELGGTPADFQPFSAEEVSKARADPKTPAQVRDLREDAVNQGAKPRSEADIPVITGAVEDYVRQCQGCHGEHGKGAPPAIPRLLGVIGYYAHVPEGRAYLVRVPGVANAPLDNARLAAVLNWTLQAYSAAQLPKYFQPFTTEEVARLRAEKLTWVVATRAELMRRLEQEGVIDPQDMALVLGK